MLLPFAKGAVGRGRNQRVDIVVCMSDSLMLLVEFKLLSSFTKDSRDREKLLEI